MRDLLLLFLFLLIGAFLFACEEDAQEDVEEKLDIVGTWTDDFDTVHTISSDSWSAVYADTGSGSFTGVVHFEKFDNDAMYVVGQNDSVQSWQPSLWSRYDWTFDGDDLYYCQTRYDAADMEEAVNDDSADPTDLKEGCAGFAWSLLVSSK